MSTTRLRIADERPVPLLIQQLNRLVALAVLDALTPPQGRHQTGRHSGTPRPIVRKVVGL